MGLFTDGRARRVFERRRGSGSPICISALITQEPFESCLRLLQPENCYNHRMNKIPYFLFLLLLHFALHGVAQAGERPDLNANVLPILRLHCVQCHGPTKQEGRLSLALPSAIKRGGKLGPAVIPNEPEKSLIWKRVAADEMPPDKPLSVEDKSILREWIALGAVGLPAHVAETAVGEEHWAFLPIQTVPVPQLKQTSLRLTDVDRYIQAKLEEHGLTIGNEASREVLIRRVSFDLTGLPPAISEIDDFLQDQRTDAYERMVDRYLSSQHYGERWGKYWLDAAGYADSNGYFNADTDRPLAYRYRDYVVRSLNADKRWDEFVREQIAGDELAGYERGGEVRPDMVERLEGAHFIRNSPDGTDSSDGNPDEVKADKYAALEGTLQIMGSSLLGVTLQCARCHDHKFEPLTQRDYYALQAVIYPALNVDQWLMPKQRDITTATREELTAREQAIKAIDAKIAEQRSEFAEWARLNRERGHELFVDTFDSDRPLKERWTNTAPGDQQPGGTPPVELDQATAPAARVSNGVLQVLESGSAGDRLLATQQVFDWTPETVGGWIQATFDLVPGDKPAPYVGYFIALREFNDQREFVGGNVLIDGAMAGKATVDIDYPGKDSVRKGSIGTSGYQPGFNYGVRVTRVGDDKYELAQLVNGIPEEGTVTLSAADLPDGAFGFEYCCGRSYLVDRVIIETDVPGEDSETTKKRNALQRQRKNELSEAIKQLESSKPKPIGLLASVSEPAADPPIVRLLKRGDYKTPGEEISASAPAAFSERTNPSEFGLKPSGIKTSGRRLAFANWITRPDSRASALLARVTVNRWWQHHFGTGIVATADNLGYSGSPPSHPELLEYLAGQLIQQGWSAKSFHRLIMNSAAYRQSSRPVAAAETIDADHRLLASFPLHRLDAEALRDAMLSVSGELDLKIHGPYVPTQWSAEGDVVIPDQTQGAFRRSLYIQQRRTQVMGLLETFDAPAMTYNCVVRPRTTVPLQSLSLLNSDFIRKRAAAYAKRIRPTSETNEDEALTNAFRSAWGRRPTPEERDASLQFLQDQPGEYADRPDSLDRAWIDFCQMLLAANAFLYLD